MKSKTVQSAFCHPINLYQSEFAGRDILVAFVFSQSVTCFVQRFVSVQAFFWINSTLWSFFQAATSFVSAVKVCQKVKLFASRAHPESSFFHYKNLYQVLVGSPGSLVTVRPVVIVCLEGIFWAISFDTKFKSYFSASCFRTTLSI